MPLSLLSPESSVLSLPHLREGRTGRGHLHLHRRALAFIGRGGLGGGSDSGRAGSERMGYRSDCPSRRRTGKIAGSADTTRLAWVCRFSDDVYPRNEAEDMLMQA